jgi:simple sugar transport system substrate-binding protein
MNHRTRGLASVAALSAMMLAVTACSSDNAVNAEKTTEASGGKGGYGYKIAVVTHGSAGDAFWSIVKNGVEKAGADMGDTISYSSDGDPQKQAQLIDAAVNQKVDGLVVSMANPDALKASVEKAVAAGIPVISINSGASRSKEFGALTHIGQDEKVAGEAVGAELKKQGIKKGICVIHEAGNVGLEERCAAVASTLGAPIENLQVDINNLQSSQATIKSKLQSDTAVDGVVTLGGPVAAVAAAGIGEAGSAAKLATFDLNADVAKGVQDGKILFAVDQQPYLQGYLGVDEIWLWHRNGNAIGGGRPVLTGPNIVTPQDAGRVAEFAEKGTR